MNTEYSLETALAQALDQEAFDHAVEAATEAAYAGLEEQTQLEHGIQAYVHFMNVREANR